MLASESPSRLRTLAIVIVGSIVMIYGIGARKMGGPHYGCTDPSAACVDARGFAWIPLLAVIIGSLMLASQCFTMRAFKNMYMLGVAVMAYALLSGFLGNLACGFDAPSQKINGCTGSMSGAFAHLGLSGLVVIAVTTIFLKSAQHRGLIQPDPQPTTREPSTLAADDRGTSDSTI